jgi:hypothetical protein
VFRRQAIEQVREGFRVHQTVFDGDVEHQLRRHLRGRVRIRESVLQCCVERLTYPLVVASDFRDGGPVRGRIGRESIPHGVYAEGEQTVEFRCEGFQARETVAKQVPVEGLEMAEVEEETMPLGNRSLVEGIGSDQIEKQVGADAGLRQATQQFRPVFAGAIICGNHTVPPVLSALRRLRNTAMIAGKCPVYHRVSAD